MLVKALRGHKAKPSGAWGLRRLACFLIPAHVDDFGLIEPPHFSYHKYSVDGARTIGELPGEGLDACR